MSTSPLVENLKPGEVIAAGAVFPVVAIVITAMRFRARRKQGTKLGPDDWTILAALCTLIAMGIELIYGVAKHALAYPTPTPHYATELEALEATIPQSVLSFKLVFSVSLWGLACYCLTKCSILFFYRRIFVVYTNSFLDLLTKSFLVIVILWTLGFLFAIIFSCGTHFNALWGSTLQGLTYCSDSTKDWKALSVTDLILDVVIIAMPLPYVWKLNMPLRKRLAVCGIFLIGLTAIVASIARLAVFFILFSEGKRGHRDPDESNTIGLYWLMLEAGLSVIVASLPSLGLLLDGKNFMNWLSSTTSILSLSFLRSRGTRTTSQSTSSVREHMSKTETPSDSMKQYDLEELRSTGSYTNHGSEHEEESQSWEVYQQTTIKQDVQEV